MPSRQEIAEAVAILTGGRLLQAGAGAVRTARAETAAFKALSRTAQLRAAGVATGRAAKFTGRHAITKNPWGVAALLAYEGYIRRDEIADLAESLGGAIDEAVTGPPKTNGTKKRTISKANRAVKYAMGTLKAGTKATTGADKGVIPIGAFKTSTKAAGLANPNTPSKIGKGKSKVKNLARKIKRWWK